MNATLEATKETQVLFEDQSEAAKKKARSHALGKMKDGDVPQLIDVDMPDGVTIKMKASLSLNVSPVVELTATALESIRSMIVSLPDDAPLHTRNPGITWRADKKAWTAGKTEGGKRVSKQFKPSDESKDAIKAARDAAAVWIKDGDGALGEPHADEQSAPEMSPQSAPVLLPQDAGDAAADPAVGDEPA